MKKILAYFTTLGLLLVSTAACGDDMQKLKTGGIMRFIIFSLTILLLAAPAFAGTHEAPPQPSAIMYVDITCDPKNNYFQLTPHNIPANEVAGRIASDKKLSVLQGKSSGIFVNGQFMAEKTYNYSCSLSQARVEVDMDYYSQAWIKPLCGQAINDKYKDWDKKFSHGQCLARDNGDIRIWKGNKIIATIGADMGTEYGYIHSILMFSYKTLNSCSSNSSSFGCETQFVDDMIKTPIFWKSVLVKFASR